MAMQLIVPNTTVQMTNITTAILMSWDQFTLDRHTILITNDNNDNIIKVDVDVKQQRACRSHSITNYIKFLNSGRCTKTEYKGILYHDVHSCNMLFLSGSINYIIPSSNMPVSFIISGMHIALTFQQDNVRTLDKCSCCQCLLYP